MISLFVFVGSHVVSLSCAAILGYTVGCLAGYDRAIADLKESLDEIEGCK